MACILLVWRQRSWTLGCVLHVPRRQCSPDDGALGMTCPPLLSRHGRGVGAGGAGPRGWLLCGSGRGGVAVGARPLRPAARQPRAAGGVGDGQAQPQRARHGRQPPAPGAAAQGALSSSLRPGFLRKKGCCITGHGPVQGLVRLRVGQRQSGTCIRRPLDCLWSPALQLWLRFAFPLVPLTRCSLEIAPLGLDPSNPPRPLHCPLPSGRAASGVAAHPRHQVPQVPPPAAVPPPTVDRRHGGCQDRGPAGHLPEAAGCGTAGTATGQGGMNRIAAGKGGCTALRCLWDGMGIAHCAAAWKGRMHRVVLPLGLDECPRGAGKQHSCLLHVLMWLHRLRIG